MFRKSITLYCPICDGPLGTFEQNKVTIVICSTEDCRVKWCFKPSEKLPVALDYPGKKISKICGCESCRDRDITKPH